MSGFKSILISGLLALLVCSSVSAADVNSAAEQAKQNAAAYSGSIKAPSLSDLPAAQREAAQSVVNQVNSEAYQQRVQKYVDQLVGGEVFKDGKTGAFNYYTDTKMTEKGKAQKGKLGSGERVYIFVSSSIPIDTLRNYAKDIDALDETNIVMVMRGFVGGAKEIKPTMSFLAQILHKDKNCQFSGSMNCDGFGAAVLIDPELFRRYKPAVVPAVVYVKNVKPLHPDMSEGSDDIVGVLNESDVYTVYGDASLGYMLDVINREVKSSTLEAAVRGLGR